MVKSDVLSTAVCISCPGNLPVQTPLVRLITNKECKWLQQFSSKTILLWLVVLFCLLSGNVQAQLKAKIGYDSVSTCPPMAAQFIDSSIGEPDAWYWDFGNGETSTLPNAAATYTAPGAYTVKLKVQKGLLVDSAYQTVYVLGVNAGFSYTYNNICSTPSTFHFIADQPDNEANYHWAFGNSSISIEQNPTHTFSTGKYKVSLETISKEGCLDSSVQTIQVGNIKADFQTPAVTCVHETTIFTNTTGVTPLNVTWKVNGTVFKTGAGDASYSFTAPGTYTIELSEDFGSCQDKLTRTTQVYDKPKAQFAASGTLQSCKYPSTVQFSNSSTNAVAYKWFFGDGDSSTQNAPSHTYKKEGQFSPMLVAFNANGCSDTLVKDGLVLLGPPVINSYTGMPTSGCVPLDVKPRLNVSTPEPIASYLWLFGDGDFSNDANPTHTYSRVGKYDITVVIKTVSGCSTTLTDTNAVVVGKETMPDFKVSKTVVCGNEPVQFTDYSGGNISSWRWNLTDTITKEQNPVFRFKSPGPKTITLSTKNNGCVTKLTKENYILVKPPFSAKNIQYDCSNQLKVTFSDQSQQPLTWLWNFGDGTTSNVQNPPIHTYSAPGQYLVTLTTTNGSCTNIDSSVIAITNEKPIFTFNPPGGYICPGGTIGIGVANPAFVQDYAWSFGDGIQEFSDTSVQHTYYNKGTYYPSLIVKYLTNCIDSASSSIPVTVTAPTAAFSVAQAAVCALDTLLFLDKSSSEGTDTIVTRQWSFGDAQSAIINNPPYTHVYKEGGTYKAKLTVTDVGHCSDSTARTVVVKDLPPVSAGENSFVCLGNSIQLTASGAVSYTWQNNEDLSCINCISPTANPAHSATYYVTGTGSNGCRAQDSVFIKVEEPFTLFIANTSLNMCSGRSVQLEASGGELYNWQPATSLSNAAVYNPVATPAATTMYTVVASDSNHCFSDTGQITVQVFPSPEVSILNPTLEVEQGSQNIIATTGSNDITRWYWYPSSGLSCSNCPQPMVTAKDDITYTAVVSNNKGCTDTATLVVHILCNSAKIFVPTAFTPNGDGKNDRFYIITAGSVPLRSLVIYSRNGNRVFMKQHSKTNIAAEGWDGMYNGVQMPPGVYVFMAEVMCNGESVPLKGTITLIR